MYGAPDCQQPTCHIDKRQSFIAHLSSMLSPCRPSLTRRVSYRSLLEYVVANRHIAHLSSLLSPIANRLLASRSSLTCRVCYRQSPIAHSPCRQSPVAHRSLVEYVIANRQSLTRHVANRQSLTRHVANRSLANRPVAKRQSLITHSPSILSPSRRAFHRSPYRQHTVTIHALDSDDYARWWCLRTQTHGGRLLVDMTGHEANLGRGTAV